MLSFLGAIEADEFRGGFHCEVHNKKYFQVILNPFKVKDSRDHLADSKKIYIYELFSFLSFFYIIIIVGKVKSIRKYVLVLKASSNSIFTHSQ